MTTSRQRSLIALSALLGLIATQAACGSSDSTPDSRPGEAIGGSSTGTGGSTSSGGSIAASGGSVAASGGSTSTGGSVNSSGGSVAANGGSANGGGANGGRSGGGGPGGNGGNTGVAGTGGGGATFAAVSAILNFSCTGCHGGGPPHVDLTPTNLYNSLTKPLATSDNFCKGTTLVTAGMGSASFLVKVISGGGACPKGAGTIPRMPFNGGALAAADIKTISDWIDAGAKMQ